MKIKPTFSHMNSLRVKVILIILVMTLPLIIMLIYNNFYSIKIVREQVADSYKSTLFFHMSQIDNNLNSIDSYMQTTAGNSLDLLSLSYADNDTDYYMAKLYLFNNLKKEILLYSPIDSFFVYTKSRDDYMNVSGRVISYHEQQNLQNYLVNWINEGYAVNSSSADRWHYIKVEDSYYIVDIVRSGDTYLGAWIKVEHIINPLKTILLGQVSTLVVANDEGIPFSSHSFIEDEHISLELNQNYYLSGDKTKYIVVGTASEKGDFNIYALLPDKDILVKLPYLQKVVWVVSILAMLSIPIGFIALRYSILVPLYKVLTAMKRVRNGDWSIRVKSQRTSDEFQLLGYTFNSMMDEIQELKENVYEEQIKKQREELQRLQLQLNPHFYLNTLNIIYNLAKTNKVDLIKEMSLYLVKYFRFLFRSNTSFVKVKDEIEHTINYLKIQQLRFPNQLVWKIDSPMYLSEMPVPPLIIQSFVENTIKHAISMEEAIQLVVQVSLVERQNSPYMEIKITDTGPGFSKAILQKIQMGTNIESESGEHTGLWNISRRLKLLYGNRASLMINNSVITGGAVIELILPVNQEREESNGN